MRKETEKAFTQEFEALVRSRQPWEAWSDFVHLAAISINNTTEPRAAIREEREAQYLRIIAKYSTEDQHRMPKMFALTVQALEEEQADFLGRMYMTLELYNHWKGQFFTPDSVCRMMADTQLHDVAEQVEQKGYISVCDPACGAGATLIAALGTAQTQLTAKGLNWQDHVMAVGQDIDEVCGLMCYIQLALLGAAGYVKIGNTLSEPISEQDTQVERYWYTPMWYSWVWHWRRVFHSFGKPESGTERIKTDDFENEPNKNAGFDNKTDDFDNDLDKTEPQAPAEVAEVDPLDLDALLRM